mmetsp:Transcript_103196/g.296145  ORF Transcript_103196/g.296145 Transcript_103196/m.296145 type:complete len:270 (+) Transcript_103196:447-1256(+)
MSTLLDEVLRVPVTHSTLIQDGVESGMFYNHSTESIDIIDLHQLMFAQMRTLSPNYYHVWVGFEDASFLGYYQSGINTDLCSESAMSEDECEYYSISMQQGEGHACDYAYTHAQWTSGGSPGAEDATNFPDLPAVSDPCSGQNTACRTTLQMGCREYFMADQNRGLPDESFGGAPYDARKRGWYYSTKENVKKQFSGKYVDKAVGKLRFATAAATTPMPLAVVAIDKLLLLLPPRRRRRYCASDVDADVDVIADDTTRPISHRSRRVRL